MHSIKVYHDFRKNPKEERKFLPPYIFYEIDGRPSKMRSIALPGNYSKEQFQIEKESVAAKKEIEKFERFFDLELERYPTKVKNLSWVKDNFELMHTPIIKLNRHVIDSLVNEIPDNTPVGIGKDIDYFLEGQRFLEEFITSKYAGGEDDQTLLAWFGYDMKERLMDFLEDKLASKNDTIELCNLDTKTNFENRKLNSPIDIFYRIELGLIHSKEVLKNYKELFWN